MQVGIKNRLRFISLLPIFIVLSVTSYFVYDSYKNYVAAQVIQEKLSGNRKLNELVTNLSRERGMTVMYLGNSSPNTLKSLIKQRQIVDKKAAEYFSFIASQKALQEGKSSTSAQAVKQLKNALQKIKIARTKVNNHETDFQEIYEDIYGRAQTIAIKDLENITLDQIDPTITTDATKYISFVRANHFTANERDFISYAIARSTSLSENEINQWISIIAKADAISYDTLRDNNLVKKLNEIFKDEDAVELFEDINSERASILIAANSGKYQTNAGIWFAMLSEKTNILSNAENVLLTAMDTRAITIKTDAMKILAITISVWLVSIILAILAYLLSNEIARNIKNLEDVLKRVAEDTSDGESTVDINLNTSKGTAEAYALLERIIEQTRQDKEAAQEASEAKSMFLANMSHEIRTPLNGIVGFTELLKDTGLQEEQAEFVEIIEKSSENLLEIINNILDLSKIESNKLEIEDIVFNPVDEFESAVEIYAVRASEKHIDLGCFIDPELEQPLKGDPTKIKEVIINLLSNAVKFTSSGGAINVDIRKLESSQDRITRVRFEVKDSGIGVTSEQKAKIFEAFSQADTSITRKYGGTGLGLTISARFIELMGGQLDLHSEPGEGTTFFFTIDFEEIDTKKESAKGAFSHLNAFILESTIKTKKQDIYLREYLDFYGVHYTVYQNLKELDTLQNERKYNLLFIDYEYVTEDELSVYSDMEQGLVLLTKSNFMKRIETMDLHVYKTIYEPLNNTKIKQTLENYKAQTLATSTKKAAPRVFDAESSRFNANVLVAEDNIINQKLIKRTLEDIGLRVSLASNGLEAFQKRKDGNFDLIFMDIQMPFLDGMEATQAILEYEEEYNQPHVPVVALTANALKGDRERFLSAGLDEYTTKPLVRTEIITLLNHFLADHIEDVNAIETQTQDENETEAVMQTLEATQDDALDFFDEEVIKLNNIQEPHMQQTPDVSTQEVPQELENDEKEKEDIVQQEKQDEPQVEQTAYSSDILVAKQSLFESKLFAKILDKLGYSYEIALNTQDLLTKAQEHHYKVVVFDEELEGLQIEKFAQDLKTYTPKCSLVLIQNSSSTDEEETKYENVDEQIHNMINKDLLRLILEKFIKDEK